MRSSSIASILICIAAILSGPVRAQDPEAVRLLEAALQKLGGAEKIKGFKSIYFAAKGFEDSAANAQPFTPGKEARSPHEEKLAVFLDGRRLAYELKTDRGDGTTRHRRFYFPDTRRVVADFVTKSVFASNISYPSTDRDQDARRIPHALLLEVMANSSGLRSAGTRPFDGRDQDVISAMLPNAKMPVLIYLDRQTQLLSKYEFTADFPGLGPTLFEYTFSDYKPHAELGYFPGGHEIRVNGKTFRGMTIDKSGVNLAEADAMLQLPAELEGFITPAGTVKEIAKGVYFVYGVGGFQPMFIEFKDFVVAIEAPANVPLLEDTPVETIGNMNAASAEFIAKMRSVVPTKPIRYVVITHGHADHFGGLRAFTSEKPTVITTPGNKAYFEGFVPELKVETFDRKRTITDGEMSLELINVGRNPHTEENIVAYLPKEKFLFQGDLFYFNGDSTFPAKDRMTVMPFFADWLKKNDLAPERIYGFHSTVFGSIRHIEKVRVLAADRTNSIAGAWAGEVVREGKRWRVGVNAREAGGEIKASVDFIDLDVTDIPFPATKSGERIRLERPQPSGNPIVFDGEVIGDSFVGKWMGFGVDGDFHLKRIDAKAKRYREEEVTFSNGDVALAGTLLLPIGQTKKTPAVVLVHGSSPNERTTYKSWARRFADNGIAALVYDKRGSGGSTGNTRAASMENLADDAIGGVKMLRLRSDIDADRVGIAGHSQGGWIAPLAAARTSDVAFVIVSGAAAVTPAEQSIYHRAGVMRQRGITDAEIAEATALREKLYDLNRKILANDSAVTEIRSAISKELTRNKDARWFGPAELPPELTGDLPPRGALELLFFDASPVWPKVKVPVLAMWGDRDTVVPVEKSRELIKTYLEKAGNKNLTIKILAGVDHGNNVVSKSGEWDFPRANAEYDRTMVEWVLKQFGPNLASSSGRRKF